MLSADEFYERFDVLEEREEVLKRMTNDELQHLIDTSNIVYAKIYFKEFMK
ncbi:MAG: hypothetical protein IKE91_07595 [Clostridia bacterium]|nr:hypothetical protein [Clostridia bacterium]